MARQKVDQPAGRTQGLSRRGGRAGLGVMIANEMHYALPPRSAVARQLKKVAREGRENLILRNEAKPSGGSPAMRFPAAKTSSTPSL